MQRIRPNRMFCEEYKFFVFAFAGECDGMIMIYENTNWFLLNTHKDLRSRDVSKTTVKHNENVADEKNKTSSGIACFCQSSIIITFPFSP